jgi:hypothetical protein
MKRLQCTVMTSALLTSLLYGCGSNQTSDSPSAREPDNSASVEEELGSIELQLSFPNGTSLDMLTYSIASFWGIFVQGTVPVGDEAIVSFQVGNLQAMPDPFSYNLTLTAYTSDGVYCSSSPVYFGVFAGETTTISATLVCGADAPPLTGNVRAEVDIVRQPNCGYVAGIGSPSLRAKLGDAISLEGHATVVNASFAWSVSPAGAGTFTQPNSGYTSFVCGEPGTHELALAVTGEPGCETDVDRVVVTCLPDEPEPPPEG